MHDIRIAYNIYLLQYSVYTSIDKQIFRLLKNVLFTCMSCIFKSNLRTQSLIVIITYS